MSETVRQTKYPWLVGVAVAGIAAVYFVLLGSSDFPEPGSNIEYNIEEFAALDKIETRFEEKGQIVPDVQDIRAIAAVSGKLYVAGKDAVVVLGENDREIARFAVPGTPNCIAAAPDGAIFVGMRNKVCVADGAYTVQAEWDQFAARSYITSIAVHDENVYVADAGKRVVYCFDRKGALQSRIGEKDSARDVPGLEVPSPYLDLAVNSDGELWVVNPGKLGLEQYRNNGDLVTSWYRPSLKLDGFPGCCNPTHIAFTSSGRLVTCEKGLIRVKMYDVTSGEFDGLVVGSGLFPRVQSVRDLAVDSRDRILVLDPRSNSIRIFALKETTHGPTDQPA